MAQLQITIDDGPDAIKDLDKILKTIDDEAPRVVAAFFVIGAELAGNQKALESIVAAKHVLGNHSWDHFGRPGGQAAYSEKEIRDQFDRTHAEVLQATKVTMKHWRAPRLDGVARIGSILTTGSRPLYTLSHCDVHGDSKDWEVNTADKMLAHIYKGLQHFASIKSPRLLFHVLQHTAAALPAVLRDLKAKGHTFVNFQQVS